MSRNPNPDPTNLARARTLNLARYEKGAQMEEQVIIGTPGKVRCRPASRKPSAAAALRPLPVHPLHAFARLRNTLRAFSCLAGLALVLA